MNEYMYMTSFGASELRRPTEFRQVTPSRTSSLTERVFVFIQIIDALLSMRLPPGLEA